MYVLAVLTWAEMPLREEEESIIQKATYMLTLHQFNFDGTKILDCDQIVKLLAEIIEFKRQI